MRFSAPLVPIGPALSPHRGMQLPVDAVPTIRDALARYAHGAAVVVVSDGEVRVEPRDELVMHYRRVGVRELVVRLRGAAVPAGHVLVLVDGERGAGVRLVELATLFGAGGAI